MNRAITVKQLIHKRFEVMQFDGEFEASFGIPEMSGVWIVWGASGNGKTRLSIQLAKYITSFGRVAYNTLEEGARLSMSRVAISENMIDVAHKFHFLHRESIEDLSVRLRRRRSPQIIIIDSLQYTGMTKREYIAFKEEFENKLLIFISHADGKNPEGRLAKFVRYDADVKVRVEGYKAFVVSRYKSGNGAPFVIWPEGAEIYWGNELKTK